jgi:hypothetical protein
LIKNTIRAIITAVSRKRARYIQSHHFFRSEKRGDFESLFFAEAKKKKRVKPRSL